MRPRPETRPVAICSIVVCATIVFVGGDVTIVSAQDNRDARATQLLDFGFSVTGAYDSDASQDVLFPSSSQLQPAGSSAWGVGSLSYIRRFSRAELQTSASSAVRYLPDLREFHSVMHTGALGVASSLPNRFVLKANTGLAYSPSYLYGLFPTLPATSDTEPIAGYSDPYDVDASSSYSSNSSLALDRRIGRRSTLSLVADFTHTDFANSDSLLETPIAITTRPDLTVYSIGGRFSRNFTRDNAVSVGYRYRTGEFGYALGRTTGEHAIDIGLDMSRRLSATRRVNFSGRIGGSAVDVPDFSLFNTVRQYRFDTELSASYPILRASHLRGSYTRGLQFVAGLTRPVFANGFTAEFNGVLLRRLEVLARVGLAQGQSVVTRDQLIDTNSTQLKLGYRVTREFSAYTEYIHYQYEAGSEPLIPVAPGMPADLKRDTIRAGLEWRVPAFRK
jgi:hypothetical protein